MGSLLGQRIDDTDLGECEVKRETHVVNIEDPVPSTSWQNAELAEKIKVITTTSQLQSQDEILLGELK